MQNKSTENKSFFGIWSWLYPWRWLGVVVIIGWLFFMARLNSHSQKNHEELEQLFPWAVKQPLKTGSDWMGVFMKKNKIGYVNTITQKDKDGYLITQRSFLLLKLFGSEQKISYLSIVAVDTHFHLRHFSFELHSPLSKFSATGRVSGSFLNISINTGGSIRQIKRRYRPSLLAPVLRPYIASLKPKPGKKIKTVLFDAQMFSYTPTIIEAVAYEKLKIKDKIYRVLKLKQTFRGIDLWAWIDDKGRTLKERSSSGMMLLHQTPQEAIKGIKKGVDFIRATRIELNGLVSTPKKRNILKLHLKNIILSSFPTLSKGRQSLNQTLLTIHKEKLSLFPKIPFSILKPLSLKNPSKDVRIALQPTPLIQSDHQKIRVQARKITAHAKTQLEAVQMLERWVHTQLKKQSVVGIPSALETLQNKVGDCNEHATLLAALGRSVKIPCEIISGIAYLKGHFFYHAWNECYIGKKDKKEWWLTVDATWGESPVDVTHIAFVRGGLEKQIVLLQLMGKLRIELLP